ncbi:hypothetical protein QFC20_007305 [Naganishia adeliensis]|uniref:Uncharacterized protein n=1 Tax=Naganishia adeliensis TaxID=92952 RepID=A0ACC2V0J4_9TREE|nr:hypothetical protein QFC20_007305 [Naganishia adeliensis]
MALDESDDDGSDEEGDDAVSPDNDDYGMNGECVGEERRGANGGVSSSLHHGDDDAFYGGCLAESSRIQLLSQLTVASNTTRAIYNSLQRMPGQHFASETFPSVYQLKKSLKAEAGILPRYIDCCLHGCRAFTGPYEPDTIRRSLLQSQRTGLLATALDGIFDPSRAETEERVDVKLRHHTRRVQRRPEGTCSALRPYPRIGNRNRNVDRQFDIDSFLEPLIHDLRKLAVEGESAQRWEKIGQHETLNTFRLRAHLLTVSGDMPAEAKVMHFRGTNAKFPCRCCTMEAIRIHSKAPYYITRRTADDPAVDYANLPYREHREIMQQAYDIETAPKPGIKKKLGMNTGINGQALISVVGSIRFPSSFPLDIMHVLYENLMKELLSLWEGVYKTGRPRAPEDKQDDDDTDEGEGSDSDSPSTDYIIPKAEWLAMDNELAGSTKLTPAQMAPSLAKVSIRGTWNADSYAYFLMHAGPILLRNRLPLAHYNHFVRLSELVQLTTQLEISMEQVVDIESGYVDWVKDFEELYYMYDPHNISYCTGPIHALLHIGHYIREQGPPCHYWCFTMERHGGWLKRQVVKNRKKAIEALSNRVLLEEQIHQLIAMIEQAGPVLAWRSAALCQSRNWTTEAAEMDVHTHEGYRGRLLEKEKRGYVVSDSTYRALAKHLETVEWTEERQRTKTLIRFTLADVKRDCKGMTSYRNFISATDHGRLSWRTARSQREDGERRDCSWAKFQQFRDGNERYKYRDVLWQMQPRWGQILEFLSFNMNGCVKCVAVIAPSADTSNWIPTKPVGSGPQLIKNVNRPNPIQVVDLTALTTLAGRVPMSAQGSVVVFDTSNGVLNQEQE